MSIIFPHQPSGGGGGTIDGPVTNPVGFTATCDAATNIGDPVKSSLIAGQVESLISNVFSDLCIGVVIEKPTPTTCIVGIIGVVCGIGAGLSIGKALFIGPSGQLTTTRPTTGHLQILGTAIGTENILLNVSTNKTVLV